MKSQSSSKRRNFTETRSWKPLRKKSYIISTNQQSNWGFQYKMDLKYFLKVLLDTINAWTSSFCVQFEFHRASELRVRLHSDVTFFPVFEFKLEFGDKFSNFLPEYFENFKFYRVQVCLTHKSWSSSLIKLEIWALKLVQFSSLE